MKPEIAERSHRIGARLRSERQRRGWSLSTLSARTDGLLSKSRISNYEQGIRRMGLEAASQLATALETVTPAWLLLLEEEGWPSDEEWALIRGYRALDLPRQRQVLDLIQAETRSESQATNY